MANRMVCRWCGASPATDPAVLLCRVNEKGVPGIWECSPWCKEEAETEKPEGR